MASLKRELYLYQYIDSIKKAFDIGSTVTLDVIGSSMLPTLHEGDKVVLAKVDSLSVGDIVLYHLHDTSYAMHRIVGIDGDMLHIMGDNNLIREIVDRANVIGVVASISHDGKEIPRGSRHYNRLYRRAKIRRFFLRVRRRLTR